MRARGTVVAVLAGLALALATRAEAAPLPPRAPPPPAPRVEPAAPAPAEAPPVPAPIPYAPPPVTYAPPPIPVGPPPPFEAGPPALPPLAPEARVAAFESDSKSHGLAFALELFLPGVGSIYAGAWQGALITWGAIIAGGLLLEQGIGGSSHLNPQTGFYEETPDNDGLILAGAALLVGSRIFGLVYSWSAVTDYNDALAVRFGVSNVALVVAPVSAGHGLAWGPALSLRF